ncbi:MAG: rod shape-determining protein RodA, partial [Candidatus Aminicenantes bacterium]|nr:rod shape-determining protein RodA [Candidatus Aminicenantes bacterium]
YAGGGFVWKQTLWAAVALLFLFLTVAVDYKFWLEISPYLYGLFLLVLLALLLFGRVTAGARSWFRLAFMGGQPSELAKIAVLLILARLFSEYRAVFVNFSFGGSAALLAGLPMAAIAFQPDIGTAFCFVPVVAGALVMAGLNRKTVVLFLVLGLAGGFLGWNVFLKDYQKTRLTTFVNPGQDPRGAGYHVLQSKIAIGSGGVDGKGFKKGTQSQLRFLPARHTDFIFAVLGEEFGFAGVLTVFILYFLFLARMFRSVGRSRDRAGSYITFMAACLLSFQFLVNVLMIIGLLPVTGIPIPLLSYGGSSLLATYIAVGLVVNIQMRRFVYV